MTRGAGGASTTSTTTARSDDMPRRRPPTLEETLLGGNRRYTRVDVSYLSGVDEEQARRLWRAMGFPDLPDDDVAFTHGDVRALQIVAGLIEQGLLDYDAAVATARAMGQALARLAESQLYVLGHAIGARAEEVEEQERLAATLVPSVEQLVLHVWHRHLAAAAGRALGADETATATVGFLDIVGYTRLSRGLSPEDLTALLERFESETSDRIARSGGRVVKMIGDEVFFVADSPAVAAEIALETAETHAADEELPEIRGGLASGPVLMRHGDVFGTTVNRAARLTPIARPGTVIVDDEVRAQLRDDGSYKVKRVRAHRLRGLGSVSPWVLRRTGEPQRE
jgi:adenylate cyclase